MKRSWAVAWRNLRRNRRRNVATAAAIALGYAGLVVLGGYATRLEGFLRANAVYMQHVGHVSVYLEGGFRKASAEPVTSQLDPKAQSQIMDWAKRDPRVEFAARYLRGVGLAGNGCVTHPTLILGVEPEALARILVHPEVQRWTPELARPIAGRWLSAAREIPHAAAVSAGLAALLEKPRVHDQAVGLPPAPIVLHCETPEQADELGRDAEVQLVGLTYDGSMAAVDAEMVATFHAAEPSAEEGSMMVSLATTQEIFATDRVTYLALFLHRAADSHAVADDLRRALAANGLHVETFPYDDERASPLYVGTRGFVSAMVTFITTLVVIVLVLTVLGAMTLTILERSREIGTLRALGFPKGEVISLVVREALLLAAIGLAIGLALGLGASAAINASGIRFSPPGVAGTVPLLIYPSAWACAAQALVIAPGVGLAAWVVARRQTKRNVVELLTSQSG